MQSDPNSLTQYPLSYLSVQETENIYRIHLPYSCTQILYSQSIRIPQGTSMTIMISSRSVAKGKVRLHMDQEASP